MKKILGYFALVLVTLTGVFLLWQLRSVLLLFVFALALAAAMRRPVDYLAARRLPRGLAVALTEEAKGLSGFSGGTPVGPHDQIE